MAIQTLTFAQQSNIMTDLIEAGAVGKRWSQRVDARIKIDENRPVGPAVYSGKIEDEGQDALFLFNDTANCSVAILENAAAIDVEDTIANYISTRGADVATMQALRPA